MEKCWGRSGPGTGAGSGKVRVCRGQSTLRAGSAVTLVNQVGSRVQSRPAGNTYRRAELRLALALAAFLGFQV